jgi:hypothetical protein
MPLNTGAFASAINYTGTMNVRLAIGLAALQKPKPFSRLVLGYSIEGGAI